MQPRTLPVPFWSRALWAWASYERRSRRRSGRGPPRWTAWRRGATARSGARRRLPPWWCGCSGRRCKTAPATSWPTRRTAASPRRPSTAGCRGCRRGSATCPARRTRPRPRFYQPRREIRQYPEKHVNKSDAISAGSFSFTLLPLQFLELAALLRNSRYSATLNWNLFWLINHLEKGFKIACLRHPHPHWRRSTSNGWSRHKSQWSTWIALVFILSKA